MGFLDRFKKGRGTPGQIISTPAYPTAAGVFVSEDQAMRLATVQACVRVLSEDVAALPLHVYRRTDNGGKERATDHPLYELLHDRPNGEMSSMDFRQALMVNVLLSGNAYAFVEYDKAGRVIALWPVVSSDVEKLRDSEDRIIYRIDGKIYAAGEILAVHGLSYDGQVGLSPIAYARATMGLAGAAEEFGSRFFGNGTNMGGIISMPGQLSDDAFERLKTEIKGQFTGLRKSHGVPILENGATYTKIGVNPEDAQFLETRKYQRSEIAAIYRVPPHMIGDLERATFSNIEHQSIEYLQRTLTPWLVRMEQAMRISLLTRDERQLYVIEHDTANFLRGDTQSRMQAYATAVQSGIMTPNECRVRDNLAPIEGGDELLRPLNMTAAGANTEPEAEAGKRNFIFGTEAQRSNMRFDRRGRRMAARIAFGDPTLRRSSEGNDNAATAVAPMTGAAAPDLTFRSYRNASLREAFADWFREQAGDILRLAERILGERDENAGQRLLEALDEYYDSIELSDEVKREAGKIAAEAFAEADRALEDIDATVSERTDDWTRGYLTRYNEECSGRIATANREDVKRIIKAGGDTVERLTEKLEKWPKQRAKYMADTERAFITNEAKIAEFRRCGYDSVWVAGAGCCKACTELNGITLKGSFRPPLHGGCTCTVGIGNAYTNSGNRDTILEELKNTGINGEIHLIPLEIDTDALRLDDNHANKERNHNVSHEEAVKFIKNAEVSITRNLNGKEFENYYSFDGAAYVNVEENLIRTAFKKKEYNEIVRGFMEVLENYGK